MRHDTRAEPPSSSTASSGQQSVNFKKRKAPNQQPSGAKKSDGSSKSSSASNSKTADSDEDEEEQREFMAKYGFSSIVAAPQRDQDSEAAESAVTAVSGTGQQTVTFKQRRPANRAVRKKNDDED